MSRVREATTSVARSGDGRKPKQYRGALQSYLKSIRRYELLTRSGEFRVATASRAGVERAKKDLVEANLRLVVKLAMDYRHTRIGLDDLIAEGNLGLIEAANRFDPKRGVRFASYGSWWIRKYIIQAIDRQTRQTTSPSRAQPAPTDEPASRAPLAGGKPLAKRDRILSYDDFMQTSGDRRVLETIASESNVDPRRVILERQLAAALAATLPLLPAQERTILAAHYGLDGQPPLTLQQIGKQLSLTRERVRQIEQRAIGRARRLLQRGGQA